MHTWHEFSRPPLWQAGGEFKKASSVQLRSTMRVSDDEVTRKACYEGMCSIGPFVAERFLEIVKCRNRLARSLGYIDYYDFKVMTRGCMCVKGLPRPSKRPELVLSIGPVNH